VEHSRIGCVISGAPCIFSCCTTTQQREPLNPPASDATGQSFFQRFAADHAIDDRARKLEIPGCDGLVVNSKQSVDALCHFLENPALLSTMAITTIISIVISTACGVEATIVTSLPRAIARHESALGIFR
jgi:hypothetical protein